MFNAVFNRNNSELMRQYNDDWQPEKVCSMTPAGRHRTDLMLATMVAGS